MSDDAVQVPPDSTGKKVDCSKVTTGAGDVERQRAAIGDDTDPVAIAKVANAKPASNAYGLAVRNIPGDPQPISHDTTHTNPLSEILINFNGAGDTPIINGVGGKVIKIWKLWLQVNGNTDLTPKDGAAALSGPLTLEQGGSWLWHLDGEPWFTCSVGNAFNFGSTGAVQVSGRAYYTQI